MAGSTKWTVALVAGLVVVNAIVGNSQATTAPSNEFIGWYDPTPEPTTLRQTSKPSQVPSRLPTLKPSNAPTVLPTRVPTQPPTQEEDWKNGTAPDLKSPAPTTEPTREPTTQPSKNPTEKPTHEPTSRPTEEPTSSPTKSAALSLKPLQMIVAAGPTNELGRHGFSNRELFSLTIAGSSGSTFVLSNSAELTWEADFTSGIIQFKLEANERDLGWLGLGLSPHSEMLLSRVVIGLNEASNVGRSRVAEYILNGYSASATNQFETSNLISSSFEQADGKLTLIFKTVSIGDLRILPSNGQKYESGSDDGSSETIPPSSSSGASSDQSSSTQPSGNTNNDPLIIGVAVSGGICVVMVAVIVERKRRILQAEARDSARITRLTNNRVDVYEL